MVFVRKRDFAYVALLVKFDEICRIFLFDEQRICPGSYGNIVLEKQTCERRPNDDKMKNAKAEEKRI